MAFSKKQKSVMVEGYDNWLKESQAVFMLQFSGMKMKDVDDLRRKVRAAGGEFHVVKNKLMGIAMTKAGLPGAEAYLEGTTAVGFALQDAPAVAKVLSDATRNSEIFKLKGGYLEKQPVTSAEIKALADLPPLPQMRAILLGTLLAPAGQLVRVLAEPARSMASVVRAYSEQEAAQAAG